MRVATPGHAGRRIGIVVVEWGVEAQSPDGLLDLADITELESLVEPVSMQAATHGHLNGTHQISRAGTILFQRDLLGPLPALWAVAPGHGQKTQTPAVGIQKGRILGAIGDPVHAMRILRMSDPRNRAGVGIDSDAPMGVFEGW